MLDWETSTMGIIYPRIQLWNLICKRLIKYCSACILSWINVAVHTSSDIIWKLLVLTKVSVNEETLEKLKKECMEDGYFKSIFKNVPPPFRRRGRLLYFENRLCILNGSIKETVLYDNHLSLYVGHRGYNETNEYYWFVLLLPRFWTFELVRISAFCCSCCLSVLVFRQLFAVSNLFKFFTATSLSINLRHVYKQRATTHRLVLRISIK